MSDPVTNALSVVPTPEILDLIQKVDTFYNTSWNHLLLYSGITITALGVVLPLLIQWFQTRSIRREEEASITKINSLVAAARSDLASQLRADAETQKGHIAEQLKQYEAMLATASKTLSDDIDKRVKETRAELETQVKATTGNIYHVQGTMMLKAENYVPAVRSYLIAANQFALGKDELNLRRAITQINKCFSEINKDDIAKSPDIGNDYEALVKLLEPLDKNGGYHDSINELSKSFRAASERAKKA